MRAGSWSFRNPTGRFGAGSISIIRASKTDWVTLFKKTFRFTGGEIVGEFLLSTGYLPGAHRPDCPVYAKILKKRPPWSRNS